MGTVRVGVAICDPHGILATPVTTLTRDKRSDADITALAGLVLDNDVVEVVVGLPKTLRGDDGHAVTVVRRYGTALAELIAPIPVVYTDERLTSVSANRVLAERGVRSRQRRPIVDQLAAVAILQARLDQLPGGSPR